MQVTAHPGIARPVPGFNAEVVKEILKVAGELPLFVNRKVGATAVEAGLPAPVTCQVYPFARGVVPHEEGVELFVVATLKRVHPTSGVADMLHVGGSTTQIVF